MQPSPKSPASDCLGSQVSREKTSELTSSNPKPQQIFLLLVKKENTTLQVT